MSNVIECLRQVVDVMMAYVVMWQLLLIFSDNLRSSCIDGQAVAPPDQCNTCICFSGQVYCTNLPCPGEFQIFPNVLLFSECPQHNNFQLRQTWVLDNNSHTSLYLRLSSVCEGQFVDGRSFIRYVVSSILQKALVFSGPKLSQLILR